MVSFIRRTIKDVRLITKRFDTTHSHQKSYADKHRGPIEFEIGDLVFLKVVPMKGVIRFDKRGVCDKYITYIAPGTCRSTRSPDPSSRGENLKE